MTSRTKSNTRGKTTRLTCDHTTHLYNDRGEPMGSWVEQEVGNRVRVICGSCGRFYGWICEYRDKHKGRMR